MIAHKTTLSPWEQHKVWFLAHPCGTDDQYTLEQNRDRLLHQIKFFRGLGVKVVVPYYIDLLVFDDNNPEHREECLKITSYLVTKIKRVIFCGHKMSSGMQREYDALTEVDCCVEIINFVGVPNSIIAQRLRGLREPEVR